MESSLTSVQVVRLLAEENRRKVVAALILADGALTTNDLTSAAGLDLRAVVHAVDRLVAGGLLQSSEGPFELDAHVFQQAARAEAPPTPPSDHDDQPVDIARVLDASFKNGKLVQWPSKRTKRLMVLDHLSQQFEIGRRYKEPEINEILRFYNDDVATMRRYLVDEQFLDRGAGDYWRCGGTL